MFTWICPTCGREVPPSMSECPNCTGKQEAPAPSPPQEQQPNAPPPSAAPAARRAGGVPTWLMSLLFAALFIALGVGVYWGVQRWKQRQAGAAASTLALENPSTPSGDPARPHPLQKFIEVTGVRLIQNAKKGTDARFLVVNHSTANIADMAATVILRARGATGAAGTLSFKLPALGANESAEITTPVETKLRVYELPDWQNLEAVVRITAP